MKTRHKIAKPRKTSGLHTEPARVASSRSFTEVALQQACEALLHKSSWPRSSQAGSQKLSNSWHVLLETTNTGTNVPLRTTREIEGSAVRQRPNPSIERDVQGLSPSAAPHVKRWASHSTS